MYDLVILMVQLIILYNSILKNIQQLSIIYQRACIHLSGQKVFILFSLSREGYFLFMQ